MDSGKKSINPTIIMWRSILTTPDIIWLCVTMCAIFESRAIYNPTHMFCDLLCLRKATYVSPQHIRMSLVSKFALIWLKHNFQGKKNRWSTFRYSIIMGIGMGWSLIYKQSSAISLFHTKLIIWASYWTKTVTILQGWVSDEWESAGVLMDYQKRQKGQVCASCE